MMWPDSRVVGVIALAGSSWFAGCCFGAGATPPVPTPVVAAPVAPVAPAWPPAGPVTCTALTATGTDSYCFDFDLRFTTESQARTACSEPALLHGGRLEFGPCAIGPSAVGSCVDPGTGIMNTYYAPDWTRQRASDICAMHTPPGMFL